MSVQRRPKKGQPLPAGWKKPKWVVRYRDPSGREHSRTFTTQSAAKDFDKDQGVKLAQGTWQDPTRLKITVGQIYDSWSTSTPVRDATRWLRDYTRRLHLEPIADYPAVKLTTRDVLDWYGQMTTSRSWIDANDTGVSPATARDHLRRLRAAYRHAMADGLPVPRNPVVIPKADEGDAIDPATIPTLEENNRVIHRVRIGGAPYTRQKKDRAGRMVTHTMHYRAQPTIADMMIVGMLTGMRVSEVCGLTVGDVDLDAGVIHLTRQLDPRSRERVAQKSRAGRRDIPIVDELAPILRTHAGDRSPGAWIFTSRSGEAMRTAQMSQVISRAAACEDAPLVHFHALRHFFASSLLTAGRPVQEVSQVLGHGSPSLTLDVYTHVLDRTGAGMRDAISAAIGCGISAGSRHLKVVPDTGS